MANALRTPSGSEQIATDEKAGSKTQIAEIDIAGFGATQKILSAANPMPVMGGAGMPQKVQDDPGFDVSGDTSPGQILFVEPNKGDPVLGAWNDGVGSASIDWECPFNGNPAVRLDPQGNTLSGSDPGSSPLTNGVVFKRRLQFAVRGIYSAECWLRWTSQNNGTNTFTVIDHYNRDGTNAYLGRFWIDNTTDPITLRYLNSSGTYTQFGTVNSFPATHMYDLANGSLDKAGQWGFARLKVDFTNLTYVGIQYNDVWYSLAGIPIRTITSTGARAMHFGVSYGQKTSTRRYIHIAGLTGRRYA